MNKPLQNPGDLILMLARACDALEEYLGNCDQEGAERLHKEALQMAEDESKPEGVRILCRSIVQSADEATRGKSPGQIMKDIVDGK